MEEEMMLKIMTCDGIFYEGGVRMVEFPSTEGHLGVQRGHMPLTVLLIRGQIRFREGKGIRKAGVEKGFAVIDAEQTMIWTRAASWLS